MNSLQYAIYKGTGGKYGCVQFSLQKPHYYHGKQKDFSGSEALQDGKLKEGWKIREGCVFMEITSAKDKNVYDWDNKVIMALSVSDIGKLLVALSKTGKTEIMHDPGAKTEHQGAVKKFLNVDVTEKGVMLSCTQTSTGEKKNHAVPVSPDEAAVLRQLLQSAVSASLGW
jgi:hypothetical protein